mmetsp:Transcript_21446/g.24842  ORF Transcript_21446/g.24842 Transcript_21446/m.24842 type:complete len:84 (+) Transcript_21446:226-477(+)
MTEILGDSLFSNDQNNESRPWQHFLKNNPDSLFAQGITEEAWNLIKSETIAHPMNETINPNEILNNDVQEAGFSTKGKPLKSL